MDAIDSDRAIAVLQERIDNAMWEAVRNEADWRLPFARVYPGLLFENTIWRRLAYAGRQADNNERAKAQRVFWNEVSTWLRCGWLYEIPGAEMLWSAIGSETPNSSRRFFVSPVGAGVFATGAHSSPLSERWIGDIRSDCSSVVSLEVASALGEAQHCLRVGIIGAAAILSGVAAELVVDQLYETVESGGNAPMPTKSDARNLGSRRSFLETYFKSRLTGPEKHRLTSWVALGTCLAERRNRPAHGVLGKGLYELASGSLVMIREFLGHSEWLMAKV